MMAFAWTRHRGGGQLWTPAILLLLCLAAALGAPLPAQAGVQMTQFNVDTTPPDSPPPTSTAVHNTGLTQPLTGVTSPAVDPTIEYSNLIRSQSTQSALGNTLLGESIDYYTGETDFVTTDVSVPLNFALPMAVSRRYHVGNRAGGTLPGQFGDWDLDLPHIEVVLAQSVGWKVPSGTPGSQCSKFAAPMSATVTTGPVTTTIPASEYSQGYQLVIPGQGRRELLMRDPSNDNLPPGSASLYPVVTHDWWVATCETTATQRGSGAPNEDFVVTSPAGVTYKFSYFTTRPYPSYQRIADDQTATTGTLAVLPRMQGLMLPDTIEDRFGNWVQYQYVRDDSYNYYVSKITSSDGHTISFTLNSDFSVKQIENNSAAQGRVWKYTYTSGALTKVTLPDSTYWNIDFSDLDTASWTYTNATCTTVPTQTYPSGSSLSSSGTHANSVSGTIQHPSGASGIFTFTVKRHGRNGTPTTNNCLKNAAGTSFAAVQPAVYDVLSLTKKSITGPALPSTYSWMLAYAGCTASSCNTTKTTTVTDVRGYDTTYTFGAAYSSTVGTDTEGQVQKIQSGGQSGSGYLRTDSYTYYFNCGSSCPTTIGAVTQTRGDAAPLSTLKPINTHTITQDGATYTNTASSPDAYGFPQTITRTGTDTKTDALTYHHDSVLWVIGTLTQVSSASNTELKIIPNAFDLPQELDRFGRKVATYTYFGDGTLHAVTDNLSHATTYSSYKSGIPQGISYANSDSESAAVRYDGRITSWTDADGNKTSYAYDDGGRVKDITYPTDTPAYADLVITWTTATTGWTRKETAGTYTRTTTYDALLDPVTSNENSTRFSANRYDPDGRTTFASYAAGSVNPTHGTTYAFDGIGRLTSTTDAANNAITYTPGKNTLAVKDRDDKSTTYTYKQYDTPNFDWPVTIATPTATTTIDRDVWGKVTQLTRGIVKRVRHYNSYQQLDRATDTERADILTFDYDNAGNPWKVNRDGSLAETHGYDKRNRLTSITYASGDPSVGFDWWPSGAIKNQSRGSNSHGYTYNARHEIKTETIATDNGSYGLKYDYDALAHLKTFTYPDATQITFAPDSIGQPTTVGSFASNISFYPHGKLIKRIWR
jgi:YD repeat-containing protein